MSRRGTSVGVGPRKPRAGLLGALATVLALSGVTGGVVGAPMAHAKDTNPDFILIEADLEHILKQIQIAEAHAAGGNLLCASPHRHDRQVRPGRRPCRSVCGRSTGPSTTCWSRRTAPRTSPSRASCRPTGARAEAAPPGAPGNNPARRDSHV